MTPAAGPVRPERFATIDLVKGACMALVVVGHFHPAGTPAWYGLLYDFIYSSHMPVFMAMSGFLYGTGSGNSRFGEFIKKKFLRLMAPYLFLSVAITAIKLVAARFVRLDSTVTWSTFLKILYLPEAAAFLWFAYTLFLIFAVVGLARRMPYFLVFASVFSVALHFLPWTFPPEFMLSEFKRMFVFFVAGMVLRRHERFLFALPTWSAAVLVGLHAVLFQVSRSGPSAMVWFACSLGMGLAASIWLQVVFRRLENHGWIVRALRPMALHGTAIYLLHTSCMAPAKYAMLAWIGATTTATCAASALVVSACGIAGPILVAKYILSKNVWARRLALGEGWK